MAAFFEQYFKSIVALIIALIIVYFLLGQLKKAPGVVGTTAGKVLDAANGTLYN
jgi:hypothetical protein